MDIYILYFFLSECYYTVYSVQCTVHTVQVYKVQGKSCTYVYYPFMFDVWEAGIEPRTVALAKDLHNVISPKKRKHNS